MIGLGSYAFYWQSSSLNKNPMSLLSQIEQTGELGIGLFQVCDYEPLLSMSALEIEQVRARAAELKVQIELGTRGLDKENLLLHLELAKTFDAKLLRTMVSGTGGDNEELVEISVRMILDVIQDFENSGVELALETYEQVASSILMEIVDKVDSSALGICLDVANVVARLENPKTCTRTVNSKVKSIHVKDFAFTRTPGWVGFVFSGTCLGEGMLDYDDILKTVRPVERGINQVVEHWVPWQDTIDKTIEIEKLWTQKSIEYLRSKN